MIREGRREFPLRKGRLSSEIDLVEAVLLWGSIRDIAFFLLHGCTYVCMPGQADPGGIRSE